MKKILILLFLGFIFSSCGNTGGKTLQNSIKQKKEFMQTLSVKDFKEKINKDYILMDIRTQQEINNGIIPGTDLFLDYYNDNFVSELSKLDKNKKYLIYCAHANRTRDTLAGMKKMGFTEVFDLKGGIVEWIDNGEEVVLR